MPRFVKPATVISGDVSVPGDKSISHRAVLLGAIAEGTTEISGLSTSADVASSLRCVEALGTRVRQAENLVTLKGCAGTFRPPSAPLDAGNSGTTVRLLSGILAGHPFATTLVGDSSLSRRPMKRIIAPLERMGAAFEARDGQYLPLTVTGRRPLKAIDYQPPVASAQVKSSILLAGLFAQGTTRVREIRPTRDHTERMLPAFGARVEREGLEVRVHGPAVLHGTRVQVPGDPSSAAFLWAAAALFPGSRLRVRRVNVNPTRAAFLDVLRAMGASVVLENEGEQCGEPVADVTVQGAERLTPVEISRDVVPLLIDELPLVAVLATFASGTSLVSGAEELRVKESDRIRTTATNLAALGANIQERPDGWLIEGVSELRGGEVESYGDHRIAMAMAIAGLRSREGVEIRGFRSVEVSFPNFFEVLDVVCS